MQGFPGGCDQTPLCAGEQDGGGGGKKAATAFLSLLLH